MTGVTVTAHGFEVDAVTIANAFGLDPAQLQERMRAGEVTMMEGRLWLAIRETINSATQENPVSDCKWRLRDWS